MSVLTFSTETFRWPIMKQTLNKLNLPAVYSDKIVGKLGVIPFYITAVLRFKTIDTFVKNSYNKKSVKFFCTSLNNTDIFYLLNRYHLYILNSNIFLM